MGLRGFRIFLNGGVFLGADDADFTDSVTTLIIPREAKSAKSASSAPKSY